MSEARNSSRTISAQVLHRGAKFTLERLTLRTAGGGEVRREVVRHPGAVVILPLLRSETGERLVVLIRNDRPAVGESLWELPAGTREPGEPPETTAARELIEETGYESATLRPLCRFYTTPGLTDELMHAFLATDLRAVGQALEADESITVHPLPARKVMDMISRGDILDGKSILTLLWAASNGLLSD